MRSHARLALTLAALVLLPAAASAQSLIHVPADMDLQTAINSVFDGGAIEIATGTYTSPPPPTGVQAGGFLINDKNKSFTIRAATGATVVLDGGGIRPVVQFINSSASLGQPVTFEGLTFANGVTTVNGLAGGVTLQRATATFVNCTFQNNQANQAASASGTGGGGILVGVASTAYFTGCTWTGNAATIFGGGMAVETDSKAFVHDSTFTNNLTNRAGHYQFAAGGAIHVANSTLRVTNTRFEGNQAGYVGGAIFSFGTWTSPESTPRTDVKVANCTFVNNQAIQSSSNPQNPVPTEGGAFHAEDQTTAAIDNSRFTNNSSETGGAVNLYRAIVTVRDSVFQGNRATGTSGGATGFGGAISAISNDAVDSTTGNGTINRRAASLTVSDSLIQGASSAAQEGQTGGCLYLAGDGNTQYGLNGVTQVQDLAANRATATVTNTVFNDCDVAQINSSTGVGGAIATDLGALTLTGSIVMNSDALAGAAGSGNTSGGGLAILNQSSATIANTSIVKNSSVQFGGGLFVQGSTINVSNSNFVKNSVASGSNASNSFGGAIFVGVDTSRVLNSDGTIGTSVISENTGLPIFDDDRSGGPFNNVVYSTNQIPDGTYGTQIYTNSIGGQCCKTVAGLNSFVVHSVAKGTGNTAPASNPVVGKLLAVPPERLQTGPPSESPVPTTSSLGYAWGGASSATVDGTSKTDNAGLKAATSTGTKTMTVGSSSFTATVSDAATPQATLSANPSSINGGDSTLLSWSTPAGTFLEADFDQGLAASTSSTGSTTIAPANTTAYRYLAVTEEGGAEATTTVTVAGSLPSITSFTASPVVVDPGGASSISWSVSPAGAIVTFNGTGVTNPGSLTANPTGTTSYTLTASNGSGSVSKTITVHVNDGSAGLAGPAVTSPTASQTVNVSGVSFSWNAVSGAQGYGIRIVRQSSGETVFSGSLAGGGSTSTLISLPDGSYVFLVRGCTIDFNPPNCGSYGSVSFTVSLTAPSSAPSVTSPTNGQVLTSSTNTFTWSAVSGAQFYDVTIKNLSNSTTALHITVPSSSTSTIASLAGASYEITVKACQSACGPASTAVDFSVSIPAAPTTAPTITSKSISGNQLTVSWSAISGADLYQVQVVQPAPAGPGGGALTVASRQVSTTSATFQIPPGSAGIVVAACTGNGCGPNSSASNISPAATAPSAPQVGFPMAGTVVQGPTTLITWSRIPTDDGAGNTTYRLFVQDLSRQATALDVFTTENFHAAYFNAEGSRYDALVIADPTGTPIQGSTSGFQIAGTSSDAPTMVAPAHQSTASAGNIQLGWTPVTGATLYEYFVAVQGQPTATVRGVTTGLFVQVPLTVPATYSAIVRACPAGATCAEGSDAGWGPFSNVAGPGVTNFTVQ